MPRKTRKQKLGSQKRKAITIRPEMMAESTHPTLRNIQVSMPLHTPSPKVAISDSEKSLRSFTLKDMRKTIIIITLLFAAQAAVYFGQNQGYLSNILP